MTPAMAPVAMVLVGVLVGVAALSGGSDSQNTAKKAVVKGRIDVEVDGATQCPMLCVGLSVH